MSGDRPTWSPEVLIVVQQVVEGQLLQTVKRIDPFSRTPDERNRLAGRAIDEGLAELHRHTTSASGPVGPLP